MSKYDVELVAAIRRIHRELAGSLPRAHAQGFYEGFVKAEELLNAPKLPKKNAVAKMRERFYEKKAKCSASPELVETLKKKRKVK
jgi:hypothetical protein